MHPKTYLCQDEICPLVNGHIGPLVWYWRREYGQPAIVLNHTGYIGNVMLLAEEIESAELVEYHILRLYPDLGISHYVELQLYSIVIAASCNHEMAMNGKPNTHEYYDIDDFGGSDYEPWRTV